MMKKKRSIVLFIAQSLDGYIATKDDSLEWLMKIEGEGDNGFSEFYETVDTVIMGKKTYDWLMKQDIQEFPYKDKECYVFTRAVVENTENVKFVNDDVTHFIHNLQAKDGKKIWIVGGGELLHSFIQEKLVDEFIITVAPTIIGNGISLFREGDYHLELSLKRVRNFNQFVELHYKKRR